jgi:hypothetical protein
MAFLSRRKDGRIEIRETRRTPRGPRATTLASFRGALSPDILEAAAERAHAPLDTAALWRRAAELGIPTTERRDERATRKLIAQLRRGMLPSPVLLAALRDTLERLPAPPVPDRLAELVDWIGADEAERGRALRGLLRVSDRIVASRAPVRVREDKPFPHFVSRPSPSDVRGR